MIKKLIRSEDYLYINENAASCTWNSAWVASYIPLREGIVKRKCGEPIYEVPQEDKQLSSTSLWDLSEKKEKTHCWATPSSP